MTKLWHLYRNLAIDLFPYLTISFWLFHTHPTIWLDEDVLRYAETWYTLPYGPFSALGPLSADTIRSFASILPILNICGLILFVLPGLRLRIAGGLMAGFAALVIDGVNYGSGKIDHQAISHSLPALIVIGEMMGHELLLVKSALCFFYFQSVAGKVFTGWLNIDQFAFRDWLLLYRDFYRVQTSLGNWLLTNFHSTLWWKIADYIVILSEGFVLFLWLRIRVNRYLAMQILLLFHFVIWLIFGIDFTKLLLPVYWWAMRNKENTGTPVEKWSWLTWGVSGLLLTRFFGVQTQFFVLSLLCLVGSGIDHCLFVGLLNSPLSGVFRKPWNAGLFGSWVLLNLATITLAVLGYEPFPSYGGPIFPGSASHSDCTGACQITLIEEKSPATSDYENVRTSLIQLGLNPNSGISTSGNLGAELKRIGLDPRLWIPKLVQYAVTNGLGDHDGLHCLNHNFILLPKNAAQMTTAIKEIARERKFDIRVQWSSFGNCSSRLQPDSVF